MVWKRRRQIYSSVSASIWETEVAFIYGRGAFGIGTHCGSLPFVFIWLILREVLGDVGEVDSALINMGVVCSREWHPILAALLGGTDADTYCGFSY